MEISRRTIYITGILLISALLLFNGKAALADNSQKKPTESEIQQSREHFEKGAALEEEGKLDEAIVEYRIAAKLSPDDADIHFNLGLTYLKKKQNKEAIVEYKRVVELSPRDSEAYKLLGIAYIQEGDKKEAIRQWKNSLRINPDQPDVKEFIKMNE